MDDEVAGGGAGVGECEGCETRLLGSGDGYLLEGSWLHRLGVKGVEDCGGVEVDEVDGLGPADQVHGEGRDWEEGMDVPCPPLLFELYFG